MKKGLKKIKQGHICTRLAQILLTYRLTPQTTTGVSPSELLLGRRPRSRLDLLKPHTAERVEQKQLAQKRTHDDKAKERQMAVGDDVFVRNYHGSERWLPGVIAQKTGPVSFLVRLADGRNRRCHQDQVRIRSVDLSENVIPEPEVMPEVSVPLPPTDSTLPPTPSVPINLQQRLRIPLSLPTRYRVKQLMQVVLLRRSIEPKGRIRNVTVSQWIGLNLPGN